MALIVIEHSTAAYRLDFALYLGAAVGMAGALLLASPADEAWALLGWAATGALLWTLLEYALHRFVLHGLPPFKHWHAEHHRRPAALIASPTVLSATLFVALATLPSWWLLGSWPACALNFGLICGYLVYSLAHHAMHHSMPWPERRSTWLDHRRRCHALHHAAPRGDRSASGHYGVSSGLWDQLFGSHRPELGPDKRRRGL
ncbi:MAG: hypothetical protein CFE45_16455 [Burkholderiales bacterium PBB5]|nr:MAG: hypothetical protein CFE45_16455 [Burkholderiales bacterium PBB5]